MGWNDGFEIDDKPLVEKLKFSIAEFSAFKETSFRKSVEALLTTEDGKLRNKTDFIKEAMKVSDDYNVRWLETEYHQTIANANMAAKWKSFEENIDLYPNVKLVSVGDNRVRPEHKVLDGTIRPYNDPFWKTHTPPLDWGCRCNIIQTDEEPNEIPGGFQTKIEFENNPAETGKIFSKSAYLTSGGLNPEMIEEAGRFAVKMYKKVKDEVNIFYEKIILSKSREKQFNTILKENKGAVLQHKLYRKGTDHESILLAATEFAKEGRIAEMLPEINRYGFRRFREIVFPNYLLNKNPDLRINGIYYDVKRISNIDNFTTNANRAYKQDSFAILHYKGELSTTEISKIKNKIYSKNNIDSKTKEHNYPLNHFYILNKGKLTKYTRD